MTEGQSQGAGVPYLPPSVLGTTMSPSFTTEIHSASTERLASDSLEQLQRLLTDAYNERSDLRKEATKATAESNDAARRYNKWNEGFLYKRLFKDAFAARKEAADTAAAKVEELEEQLRLTTIATEIHLDTEQAEPFYQMRDAFAALSQCQRVWNVLTEKEIDRVVERSIANTAITRTPVTFSLASCDLIQWEQKVPHLPNRTGGDLYIYPGFVLYRASRQAFALIDFHDVVLRFVSTQFTEPDSVQSDSEVVGRTWAKCNKDGTPDRRFRDNYQITVAHYGTLLFSSKDGLDVRYVCSNAKSGEAFVRTWIAFQMSFATEQAKQGEAAIGEATTDLLAKARLAFERDNKAFEAFNAAYQRFSSNILSAVHEHQGERTVRAMISDEDFTAYANAIVEQISAAKEVGVQLLGLSTTAREKFGRAVQGLEAAWSAFTAGSQDKRLNGDALGPFMNAVTAFLKARADLYRSSTAALKRLGPLPL